MSDIVTSPEGEPTATLSMLGSAGTREFIRYFFASLIALIVDIGALTILTSWFAVPYLYSGALAFTLGLLTAYVLSVTWVFEHRHTRSWVAEFAFFSLY